MSFYQSEVRQTIQEIVYQKPIFKIKLFDKEYFGTIKTKKIWFFQFQRYQILWVKLPNDVNIIKQEIKNIKNIYKWWFKNIFFQIWSINEMISFDIKNLQSIEFETTIKDIRLWLHKYFKETYSLEHSFRENMPESNILQELSRTEKEILNDMNESARERAQKGIKKNIEFRVAREDEYDQFYAKRQETAGKKWFNTIPKDQYYRLIKYLVAENKWALFISKINDEIIAGTIWVYDNKNLICLYWFVNRKHTNSWWQQYLKYKIFNRWKENWFRTCDLMWWSPTWFPEHELAGVSAFKESMWWTKVDYYWNFDIVLNKYLYRLFKLLYKFKK